MAAKVIAILLFVAFLAEIRGQDYCSGSKVLQCSKTECGKLLFCQPNEPTPQDSTKCDTGAPYCRIEKSGTFDTCSAAIDPDNSICDGASSSFSCTSAGYFPDPHNCRAGHICHHIDDDTLEDQIITCSDVGAYHYFYNPATTLCTRQTATSQCYTVDCSATGPVQTPYKPNNQFWYICFGNEAKMFRCAAGEKFADGSCGYKCPKTGRLPHEDSTKFYDCVKLYLIVTAQSCPDGSHFDAAKKQCVNLLEAEVTE